MDKGTILYIGNFELPDKGAAAFRVINNGKLFGLAGYRTVFLGVSKDGAFEGVQAVQGYENMFEQAYPVGGRQWLRHLSDTANIRALAGRYPDLRLIIVYNLPLVTYKRIKKAFSETGVKTAYDCTEWSDYTEGAFFKKWYKRLDAWCIRNRLTRVCENIIAVSSEMSRQYRTGHLMMLPPLVDLDDPIWHAEKIPHPGAFVFCFAAATLENKDDPSAVIRAFTQIKDTRLRLKIIGIDKDEYARISAGADGALHDDRICFFGRLSHARTIQEILSCDCYIFVRRRTLRNNAGFPTKFTEAYTCGVPVITTDVSDVGRYIARTGNGIVLKALDPAGIRRAIEDARDGSFEISNALNASFDYRNYVREAEIWISKLR